MYTVIEIQDTIEQVGTLVYSYETENEANEKYYNILWHASSGNVPYHSATIFRDGMIIKNDRIINYEPALTGEEKSGE